jgi:hypothetical protein
MRYAPLIVVLIIGCMLNSSRFGHPNLKAKADKILDDIASGTAVNDFPELYFPRDQTTILMNLLKIIASSQSLSSVPRTDLMFKPDTLPRQLAEHRLINLGNDRNMQTGEADAPFQQ